MDIKREDINPSASHERLNLDSSQHFKGKMASNVVLLVCDLIVCSLNSQHMSVTQPHETNSSEFTGSIHLPDVGQPLASEHGVQSEPGPT